MVSVRYDRIGEGQRLARHQVAGLQRRDHQLLQGADLLLPDHGHARQHGRDDGHQDHQDARHHVDAADQLRVVEEPRGRRHPATVGRAPLGRRQPPRLLLHDARRVPRRLARRRAVDAVHGDAHGHRLAGRQVARVVARDPHGQVGPVVVQQRLQLLGTGGRRPRDEGGGGQERVLQRAALGGPVLVQERDGHPLQVQVRRVAQHQQLHDGHREDQPQDGRIAPDLQELLADEEGQGAHRRSPPSPAACRSVATPAAAAPRPWPASRRPRRGTSSGPPA